MENQFIDYLEKNQKNKIKDVFNQEDSGFKAWQSSSIALQQGTNLFRNLKSQLVNYEEKYKRLNVKTLPVKLPTLQQIKLRKRNLQLNKIQKCQDRPLTQRKANNRDKQKFLKHKSIELGKKSQKLQYDNSKQKLKVRNQNIIRENKEQKPILITKVQQMKYNQNQKRIRKRDIYLSIFGQRGKGKVQRIEFDNENKQYQMYLQRKNQQMRMITSSNLGECPLTENGQDGKIQHKGVRCVSNLNQRYHLFKKNQTANNLQVMRF